MEQESLTNKFRPKSFAQMQGQEIPKLILQKIAKEPQGFTRSLILAGSYGSGKTSSSRIFVKALNCESKTGDACNVCQSCIDINQGSNLYQEYDSSVVGNVEKMKELRDTLSYSVSNGYKVIVFDECLSYSSLLNVKNYSNKIPIGEIVEKKLPLEVLSYDFVTQEKIYKRITGWHKNSGKEVSDYIFSCIDFDKLYSISASENHIIFSEDKIEDGKYNEIKFKDLKKGDLIFGQNYILEFKEKINTRYENTTYDITVEDNHNYFANGILVHNCHLISKQAMSALLKVLEEANSNIYYLFPTTDPEKMLDTIKSRSIILTYEELTQEDMRTLLQEVCRSEGKDLPQEVENYILRRVKGHPRDALQQIQLFFKIGLEEYNKLSVLLDKEFFNIIKYTMLNDMDNVRKTIDKILKYPVPYIRQDFEEVIKKISNSIYLNHQEDVKLQDDFKNKIITELPKEKNPLKDRKLYQRIIMYYLENNRNIIDTTHWFIFLNSMVTLIKDPEFFNFK